MPALQHCATHTLLWPQQAAATYLQYYEGEGSEVQQKDAHLHQELVTSNLMQDLKGFPQGQSLTRGSGVARGTGGQQTNTNKHKQLCIPAPPPLPPPQRPPTLKPNQTLTHW